MSPSQITTGRIIHVTLDDGEVRPALVVSVHGGGLCNAQVFLDGLNDVTSSSRPKRKFNGNELHGVGNGGTYWATSIMPADAASDGGEKGQVSQPGRWHFPARV